MGFMNPNHTAYLYFLYPFYFTLFPEDHFLTSGQFSTCLNWRGVKGKGDFPGIQDYIPAYLKIISPVAFFTANI